MPGIAAGIVDTDSCCAPVHVPFCATAGGRLYDLEKRMPVARMIPCRRADADMAAFIAAETGGEAGNRIAVTASPAPVPRPGGVALRRG
ncbi:MAG: hypothetical protein Q4G25_09930 [Paracoccus sp. (in: a-proteobacteria)]|nr:hypothetical protein [Paracoccus sp. (in: a-proteobacteria)]